VGLSAVNEIGMSRALRWYGAALAMIHPLAASVWWDLAPAILSETRDAICQPYWTDCAMFRAGDPSVVETALLAYGFLGVICAGLFLAGRVRPAWWSLLLLTVFKSVVIGLDFRFRANYHNLPFVVTLAFLFVPGKARFIPVLLCLNYFFAGTLKLNMEWLSGTALYAPAFVTGRWLTILLVAVVVLELGLVWLVLARRTALFWAGFGALLSFHAFSWHIIGYIFPTTMFLLVSFLPLARREGLPGPVFPAHWFLWAGFILVQCLPFIKGGDRALTAEGRTFTISMFDAFSECDTVVNARFKSRTEEAWVRRPDVRYRRHCDPLVSFHLARALCAGHSSESEFLGVDWFLVSRRRSDKAFSVIVSETDFCSKNYTYSIWPVNKFVRTGGPVERGELARAGHVWTAPVPVSGSEVAPATSPSTAQFRGGGARFSLGTRRWVKPVEQWRLNIGNSGPPGASNSSPAVDDSGIYVGVDSSWLVALNHDGSERWRYYASESSSGVDATAALDADSVYIGAGNGRAYRLAKNDGRLMWTHKLGEGIASPALSGAHVFLGVARVPAEGFVARVGRAGGRLEWASPMMGEQTQVAPLIFEKGGLVILGDNGRHLHAFRLSDGTPAWSRNLGGEVKSTAALQGDDIFVTSWDQGLHKLNAADGSTVWRYDLGAPSQSSPLVWSEKDLVIAAARDGSIHGVSASTGLRRWRLEFGDAPNNASAILLGTRIVIPCGARGLCFIDPQGRMLHRHPTRGQITGEPAYHNGVIYFSENEPGDLVALKVSK